MALRLHCSPDSSLQLQHRIGQFSVGIADPVLRQPIRELFIGFEPVTTQQFEPAVVAEDLAAFLELLSAAIEAIPADRLNQSDAERFVASLDASLDALRRIRSHLRRATWRSE
jgi:hypothetical protein